MQELPPTHRIEAIPQRRTRRYKPRTRSSSNKVAPPRKKTRPRAKQASISVLVKALDAIFSQWVRLSHADENGMVECYTCRRYFHYKKLHAGHYISRFYKETRWSPVNVQPQCPMCNLWKRGDPVTFRERLVQEYGATKVEELEISRKIFQKLDREWLIERIAFYKALTKALTDVQ